MTINQAERACRAWPILTSRAAEGRTITYGELGAQLGIHHRAIRYVLGEIQDHCLVEKLPPLTILIVNHSGKPGTGFIAYDVDKFDEGMTLVHGYNWTTLPNPFAYASDGTTHEQLVLELAGNPSSAAEIMRKVKTRGNAQALFRDALLKTYQRRCAFTGASLPCLLEACHIVPWADCTPGERLDVRNGLLLNSAHHRLFDDDVVTVTEDFRIWCSDPEGRERKHTEHDVLLTARLHNQPMRMPKPEIMRPALEFLERRHQRPTWQRCLAK